MVVFARGSHGESRRSSQRKIIDAADGPTDDPMTFWLGVLAQYNIRTYVYFVLYGVGTPSNLSNSSSARTQYSYVVNLLHVDSPALDLHISSSHD